MKKGVAEEVKLTDLLATPNQRESVIHSANTHNKMLCGKTLELPKILPKGDAWLEWRSEERIVTTHESIARPSDCTKVRTCPLA